MKKKFTFLLVMLFLINQFDIIEYQKVKIKNEIKQIPKHIVINTIFPETCNQMYRYYVINCSNKNSKPYAIAIKIQFK
jgi:hypothetical protein